jgi:hypothetical protein
MVWGVKRDVRDRKPEIKLKDEGMKREGAEFEPKIAIAAKAWAMLCAASGRGASGWKHLRWEGQATNVKMLGTVGTVGTLARFLGKYCRFSSVPKSANGTLDGGRSEENASTSSTSSASSPQAGSPQARSAWPVGQLSVFGSRFNFQKQPAHLERLEHVAGLLGEFAGFQDDPRRSSAHVGKRQLEPVRRSTHGCSLLSKSTHRQAEPMSLPGRYVWRSIWKYESFRW